MEALDQVALEACLLEETATVEAVDTNKGMLVKIKEWETIKAKTFQTCQMRRLRMPKLLEQQRGPVIMQDLKVKMRLSARQALQDADIILLRTINKCMTSAHPRRLKK